MKNAKSLLDGLLSGQGGLGGLAKGLMGGQSGAGQSGGLGALANQAKGMLGGQGGTSSGGLGGMAGQAKGMWDRQGGVTKVAAGGGLLALLLGGKDVSKVAGGALKVGGAAVVGALAYSAWQDWQAGKSAQIAKDAPLKALPSPEGTPFMPSDQAGQDDLATRLVQTMVAAAKADGHVTPDERQRIQTQLAELGLDAEAERLIASELDTPLDVGRIANLARTPEEGAEIYAASLLVVDPDGAAEKGYLAMLAARLGLDPELVKHLHARVAELA